MCSSVYDAWFSCCQVAPFSVQLCLYPQRQDTFHRDFFRRTKFSIFHKQFFVVAHVVASEDLAMKHNTIGGAEYLLTFIDDKTRFIWVYFLKTKDEVYGKQWWRKALVTNSKQ